MIWWPDEVPTLVSETITLRPIRPTDAKDVFRAVQDPLIPMFTTVPSDYPMELAIEFTNVKVSKRFFEKSEILFVIEDMRLTNASTVSSADSNIDSNIDSSVYPFTNGFAGVISLHTIDFLNHRAEIGYWLAKEARGYGITTRAADLITEYGLTTLGFKRIEGVVNLLNEPSKNVLINAGYKYEGTMKKYITDKDGLQVDAELFAATIN